MQCGAAATRQRDIAARSMWRGAEFLPEQGAEKSVFSKAELTAVPSDWGPSVTKYRYVYSNNRVMLVDPATRTVVHKID